MSSNVVADIRGCDLFAAVLYLQVMALSTSVFDVACELFPITYSPETPYCVQSAVYPDSIYAKM